MGNEWGRLYRQERTKNQARKEKGLEGPMRSKKFYESKETGDGGLEILVKKAKF